MAKFRNIFKRRSRRTGAKSPQLVRTQTRQTEPLDEVVEAMENYYSAHPITTIQPSTAPAKRMCALDGPPMVLDDGDVQPMGGAPIAGEHLVKYFAFVLTRLRRWFRGSWTAARFENPVAWLMASRNQSRP